MDRHAGEVGTDFGALAVVRVALGTLVFEDGFARVGIALLLDERQQLIENLLSIGIRQTAAGFEQTPGTVRDLAVRMIGEGLFLIERKIGKLQLALLNG